MFPEWTVLVGVWLGAAIGSFLNVVIYRMPRGISLWSPRHSYCPSCQARLTALDLVPLLSWLLLGAKCRHCRQPIAARYLFVELVTGALFGAVWWQQLIAGQDWALAACLGVFVAALVAAIYIDLRWYIIPDQVNAAMLFAGLAYNGALYAQQRPEATTWGMPSAVAGGLSGIAALWGIAVFGRVLFRKDAMGHGDIKMARGIGAMLFPAAALVGFGLAVVIGAVAGLAQIALRRAPPPPEALENLSEEDLEPESIGSLLRCGVGYVLCIDVFGLFVPKLYERWFGEDPYAIESFEEEDTEMGPTTIPFGPALAAGAIIAALFGSELLGYLQQYWSFATGR